MYTSTEIIAFTLFVIFVVYWFFSWKKNKNTPPGPRGLPIVGYMPFMTKKPYIKFDELKRKYGPIYSLKIGSKNIVILCDFPSIKKAFAMDSFMGRPSDLPFYFSKEVLETEAFCGLPWKEQRRFALHMLRDLGFGKTRMEEHIKEEICYLLDRFEQTKGKPFKVSGMLAPSMSNNIASLMFGRRLKPDDPNRIMLDKAISDVGLLAGQSTWQIFFPLLRKIASFFRLGAPEKLRKALVSVIMFIRDEVKEHERTFDVNNLRDFIDGYLVEIEKNKNNAETTFLKPVLVDVVRLFFGAGSETVRVTVDWLMLTMAAYPDVQKRVQAEIDDVIGQERFPMKADGLKMPYTEATIMELMRWMSIVPLNILRHTLIDTELGGYSIPKDTYVIANLWSVLHDSSLWGKDTEVYRPERFLSADEKEVFKPEYFIPFSVGKRACPGEALAKVEVFLYFTSILQKFNIELPPGKIPDFDPILGIGLQPKRQDICINRRK